MDVKDSILETIGRTPLVKLSRLFADYPEGTFLGKLDMFNPNGSSKDRIALNMIEEGERRGLIKPGDTLVEPSSGNTGLGLAMIGSFKGYKVKITMPRKISQEKADLLEAFGAEVIWCPTEAGHGHPDNYVEVAKRMARENPNTIVLNQLENFANPEAHYKSTGPEVWEQTLGKVDYFVCGCGTSGTIIGTGRYLKEKNPKVQVIGIEPVGSIYSGGEVSPYYVEGTGYDYIPEIYDTAIVDTFVKVDDKAAFLTTRELAQKEAILAGGSTGASIAGLKQLLASKTIDPKGKIFVIFFHDTGRNYLSKVFNDNWMKEKGFIDA